MRPIDSYPSATQPRVNVAIVGGGPRGFQAVERLLAMLAEEGAGRLAIDLFEPRPRPGSSPPYDTDLPPFLRMNYDARHVDAWGEGAHECGVERRDLVGWLERRHPEWADPDAYIPRGIVGEYLEESFEGVARAMQAAGVTLRHVRRRVVGLERAGPTGSWVVKIQSEDVAWGPYHEVLLTTGHGSSRCDDFLEEWQGRVPVTLGPPTGPGAVRAVLETPLRPRSQAGVPVVAIRGFALTAIDAMLLLSEGRGGRFWCDDSGRTAYTPPAGDGVRMAVFSRSGRPLAARPDPHRMGPLPDLSEVWSDASVRVAEARTVPELRRVLTESATKALRCARPHDTGGPIPAQVLADRLEGGAVTGDEALADMRRSVAVACGRAPVDAAWALGEAWRQLHPALVARVSHGGLSGDERPDFQALSCEMERLGFGPPAENVERIVALAEAGVLDLAFAGGGVLEEGPDGPRLVLGERRLDIDAVVDAVIPAAGVDEESDLLGRLLRDDELCTAPGTHGVKVTPAGRPLTPTGDGVPGLAIIGRATEGCVLGLDTLSQSLHGLVDRWARQVVGSARRFREPAA